MDSEATAIDRDRFVAVAIEHGLLRENHAQKILDHAHEYNVHSSDAALTLSMLQSYEVEAINLLCRPSELAPGYELTKLIGCGSGGMVFRARQENLDRDVALKTINPHARSAQTTGERRMQREAHAIAKLRHPGIVAAYDSGFYKGRFCITMELVEGESLADYIRRSAPVPENVAWGIARQVACALSHACDIGIIHRDIKPANLLLCEPPIGTRLPAGLPFVKVADFGLASLEDQTSQITATGATLGSPAYVAPEQLNDPQVDARADIYALGATVFHMLTGHAPCVDQSPMKTIMQKTIGVDRWREEIEPVVSQGTLALFRAMTETDPVDRISDYSTLVSRIDRLVAQLDEANHSVGSLKPGSAIATSGPSELDRTILSARRSVVAGLLMAGLLLFGVLGVTALTPANLDEASQVVAADIAWEVDGFPQPLFNGNSVPRFRAAGTWRPGTTSDGSRVLVGEEGSRMTVPLTLVGRSPANMRFRIGVNVVTDGGTEVQLALIDSSSTPIAVLQLAEETAKLVASSADAQIRDAKNLRLHAAKQGDSIFQRVVLTRHSTSLTVSVNGQVVGTVEGAPVDAVTLKCTRGGASFADIDVVALQREKAPNHGLRKLSPAT